MNALQNETSPYLLQHANNPVHWYPWGEETLAKARNENKPILLSIGYSACHWCHVMAHESFEDPATAEKMNALFVNIKVDREERPDIDKIYQTAHYLLTQNNGGWPLTMFLTPNDQIPFLGGTYFPPSARHGLPAFKDLLDRVSILYRERETDVRSQNEQIVDALSEMQRHPVAPIGELSSEPLQIARDQAARAFDHRLGGFTRAPKFPHPSSLERLLRDFSRGREPDEHALHMALFTLKKMANGGIYDHLGGGFCRYSVDDQWMIPHFEKMLYDNGPLLGLYAQAWQLSGEPLFKTTVGETADWLAREMTSPDGGFYSSLDADSEGIEGKFYSFSREEISTVLGTQHEAFSRRFGLERAANFDGRWHLRIAAQFHEIANVLGGTPEAIEQSVNDAREQIFTYRQSRIRPDRDDKILTSWNALMIKGLAIAAHTLDRSDYADAAERAVGFIREKMWHEGRLLATYKDGTAHLDAYLDDYVFMIDALLHLLSARWNSANLEFAIELADCVLENFEDIEQGGFFFTAHDHESLIQRSKPFTDDALPAGNGIAAWALSRLGHLLGETRYLEASERTLSAAWASINHAPSAHNALLLALDEYLVPPTLVILRGRKMDLDLWNRELAQVYSPRQQVFSIPNEVHRLPGLLSAHKRRAAVTAYVCRGHQCLPPIGELQELSVLLSS
ncbi:MAG: hypothetical protein ACI9BW_000095 [Gammaproteobacteria bacterium]|jgi:uncharacterized protein YyaL (SSP411 family)